VKRQDVIFFVTGLIAGLICVTLGSLQSLIAILTLSYAVGPLFFLGVAGGIMITGARRYLKAEILSYLAGLVICTITYFLALFAFFAVTGFAQHWLGARASSDIVDFRIDVWLGLIAAGAVGASGIALFTALLTGKWNNAFLRRLMLAGLLTICVTFIANFAFRNYWSFLGVLLPIGNGLFCYLVGGEIWRRVERATREAVINTVCAQ